MSDWISVAEKLPSDMGDVLVAAFWHERWQTMIGWHSDSRKGSWRVYTSHGEVVPGGVTHWMPIPAPPDRRPPEGEEGTE
uniref:DUF551 domain-containing protein n=1 Tax=Myoviridae sp. ctr0w28 TaxID=2826703 RepID=A0A8S5NQN9_9CAUD|nr:MAG TPA: Protein of unknown function (DUF551) [Myoviridae sp. ctr0w28]